MSTKLALVLSIAMLICVIGAEAFRFADDEPNTSPATKKAIKPRSIDKIASDSNTENLTLTQSWLDKANEFIDRLRAIPARK